MFYRMTLGWPILMVWLCFFWLCPLCNISQSRAEEKQKLDTDKPLNTDTKNIENDEETEDFRDFEEERITLKVPEYLRGHGYSLRTESGQEFPIDKLESNKEIAIVTGDSTELVELVGKDARILDSDEALIDGAILSQLHGRFWRAGLTGGWIQFSHEAWKGVGQTGFFEETGADLLYHPGALGLMTRLAKISRKRSVDSANGLGEVISYYQGSYISLLASYELVPIPTTIFKKFHTCAFAGPVLMSHYISLKSDFTEVEDHSYHVGALIGVDLRHPIISNFWLFGRYLWNYQKIKMHDVDFSLETWGRGAQLGGYYYF